MEVKDPEFHRRQKGPFILRESRPSEIRWKYCLSHGNRYGYTITVFAERRGYSSSVFGRDGTSNFKTDNTQNEETCIGEP